MRKKEKILEKRGLALSQIFLLIIGTLCFAYLIGGEFKFVSAGGPEVSIETLKAAQIELRPPLPLPDVPVAGPSAPGGLGSWLGKTGSKFLTSIGKNMGAIIDNFLIAAALWCIIKLIGLIPGVDSGFFDQLAWAVAKGYAIGSGAVIGLNILIQTFGGAGFATGPVGWIAGGIMALFYGLACIFGWFGMCTKIEAVTFNCFAWQPVTDGKKCQECNNDELPCTKYRCESLGQGCELLNAGTKNEMCDWVNPNDVDPPIISLWNEVLTEAYQYVPEDARLPATEGGEVGVEIKPADWQSTGEECIPAFQRIDYGITLNEPAQCKVDTVRKDNYKDMRVPINLLDNRQMYDYNHSLFSIHGTNNPQSGGLDLPNNGEFEIFVRCEDRNGNSNVGTFVFKYCVSKEKDTTAPEIKITNPLNNAPIQQGVTSMKINVYVNKPSDCRWSHNNENFDKMPGTMTGPKSAEDIGANMYYKYSTTLDGLKDGVDNIFYFNCKSYPLATSEADRFAMRENYVYKLVGTKQLVIDSIKPVSGTTIKDSTYSVKVTLEAKTSAGYKDGMAKCYYKNTSQPDTSYILFGSEYKNSQSVNLWLGAGHPRYTIKCCDFAGNCDTEVTEFDVKTDFTAPNVVRVYNEGGSLKIVTDEKAECVYDTASCEYIFEDGIRMTSSDSINHFTDWSTNNNFYIKCQDEFKNQPVSDDCSIVVRPSDF